MSDGPDFLAKHAASRRAFLARTALTSPVVSLLLAQSARPAQAQTYGGGPEPSIGDTVPVSPPPQTSILITNPTSILITNPTTVLITQPTTIRVTQPTTILVTQPTTIRIN